ncbi:MAG: hypothetical protein WBA40_19295 [Roseiarcus sp.]
MPDGTVSAVIICDDIRQEMNGKQILIGVYGNAIIVPSMPFSIPLSVWMEYNPTKTGPDAVYVKLSYTTGFSVSVKADLQVNEIGPMGLGIPPIMVSGASDGTLTIELSGDGREWREIKRKDVRRGQVPALSGPAIPPPTA